MKDKLAFYSAEPNRNSLGFFNFELSLHSLRVLLVTSIAAKVVDTFSERLRVSGQKLQNVMVKYSET